MKKLLCESNPMCYGSSSALLSIIENIEHEVLCLIFGVTKEVLRDNPKVSKYIEVDNKSPSLVKKEIQSLDFDMVLVVSNTSNLQLYKELNKKVIFIHIHFFFPNVNTQFIKYVDYLVIQNFWDLNPIVSAHIKVGPIINIPVKQDLIKENMVLVNLGGGESHFIKPGINSAYGEIIIDIINRISHLFKGKRIIIAGGEMIISTIKQMTLHFGFEAVTLSNKSYLNLLSKADILITSPGLNAVFEGLYLNKPIIFLPPQNYSQVIQLSKYEKASLAFKGLNFELSEFDSQTSTEEDFTKLFLTKLNQLPFSIKSNQTIIEAIQNQFHYIHSEEYVQYSLEARTFLGPRGHQTISNFINQYYD